jgi:O-antigen/teichoic acid export membrane protein
VAEGGLFLYQTKTFPILKDKPEASTLLTNSVALRFILGLISMLIFIGIGFLSGKSTDVILFCLFLGLTLLLNNIMGAFSAVLYGYERFGLFGLISSGFQLSSALLGIAAVYAGLGLPGIGLAQLSSILVTALFTSYYVSRKVCRIQWNLSFKSVQRLFRSAIPLGIISILAILYFRTNIAILSFLKGDTVVGYYTAAFQIVGGFMVICTTFASVLLPRMSRLLSDDREKLLYLYKKAYKFMFFIGSGVAVGIIMISKPLIILLYTNEYSISADILAVLIWVTMLMFTNTLQGTLLIARNANRALLIITAISAGLNITLCFVFIPPYGFYGAAFAVLAGEFTSWILCYIYNIKFLPLRELIYMIVPTLFSCVLMAAVLYYVEFSSPIIAIPAGAFIYALSIFVFRGISLDDIHTIRNMLKFSKDY